MAVDEPVIVGLVDDGVDLESASRSTGTSRTESGHGNVAGPAAVAVGSARSHRQHELVGDVREVPEVVAVDVPGEDAQRAGHASSSGTAAAERAAGCSWSSTAASTAATEGHGTAPASPAGRRRGGARGRAGPSAPGRRQGRTRSRSGRARRRRGGRRRCRCDDQGGAGEEGGERADGGPPGQVERRAAPAAGHPGDGGTLRRLPVSTIRRPVPPGGRRRRRTPPGAHRFAGREAPGCRQTYRVRVVVPVDAGGPAQEPGGRVPVRSGPSGKARSMSAPRGAPAARCHGQQPLDLVLAVGIGDGGARRDGGGRARTPKPGGGRRAAR